MDAAELDIDDNVVAVLAGRDSPDVTVTVGGFGGATRLSSMTISESPSATLMTPTGLRLQDRGASASRSCEESMHSWEGCAISCVNSDVCEWKFV